jgi:hypothetical protein
VFNALPLLLLLLLLPLLAQMPERTPAPNGVLDKKLVSGQGGRGREKKGGRE